MRTSDVPGSVLRYFLPEEANAVLPRLRPLLAALREAVHAQRFAEEQVVDLRRMAGEAPFSDAAHPDHAEAQRWAAQADEQRRRVGQLVAEVRALGADVKDPLLGLVDFYAKRRGETVLLCYRSDEETVAHWHTLTDGYAGRRPLREF